MIEIDGLRFQYPRSEFQLVIDQLKLGRGERVAIVGPSGSGKTTLLNLISGIQSSAQGNINVLDQTVSKMSDAQRRNFRIANIGMVFQQFELVDYLNARENILVPYRINPSLSLSTEVRARADRLAESLGISDKLSRHPQKLSQGEQQRVAICRALIAEPKIILADEPTGNLDPTNKQKILDILTSESQDNDQILIVVTHDMNILDGFERVIDFANFRTIAAATGAAS